MNKLELQRLHPDHFRALGFNLPENTSPDNTKWYQPVLQCDHEYCFLTLDDIMDETMEKILELVPAQSCTIYLYDKRSRLLVTRASTNPKREVDVKFGPAMGIVGRCFSRKVPLNLEKPSENPLFEAKSDGKINKGAESMLCIPIIAEEKAIGLFQLINRIGTKRDKFYDLDRYLEGFNNLKLGAEQQGRALSENAFQPREVSTLMEYASLIAESIQYSMKKLDEAQTTNDNSALDLLNLLNGKLSATSVKSSFSILPEKDPNEHIQKQRESTARVVAKLRSHRKSRTILLAKPTVNMKEIFIKAAVKCQSYGRGWLVRRQRMLDTLRMERDKRVELRQTRALRIQRTFRGKRARDGVKEMRAAMEVIGNSILQYVQRRREPCHVQKLGSPRTRRVWAKTTSALVTERAKVKQKRITTIQKLFRGNKARKQVKKAFGASNPAKVYRCFVKLQARFKGRLVRKLIEKHTILHLATLQRPTAVPPMSTIRSKSNQIGPPQLESKAYPRCHTGFNQYIVASRGHVSDLAPIFDALRSGKTVHGRQLPLIRPQEAPPLDLLSRRLIGVAPAKSEVLPQIPRPNNSSRGKQDISRLLMRSRERKCGPTRSVPYHYDLGLSKRRSAIMRAAEPDASSPSFDIDQFAKYRTHAAAIAVGAPIPPPPRPRESNATTTRPFLFLAQYGRSAKREGVRKALDELKTFYQSRVSTQPISRRKSIKEVMNECSSLVKSQSMRVIIHRVKAVPGVNLNAPLAPETILEEDSVGPMDSVDSLALDFRPVTPMLEAIQLVPPDITFDNNVNMGDDDSERNNNIYL